MASYSGRFISNLEKDDYVGSGPNKCQLRDDKFTHKQVSKHNRADDCLVSVNGNVYDIDKYKKNIENNKPPGLKKVFLDLDCGGNYEVIKEKDVFQLKKLKTYKDDGFFNNLKEKIKSKYYYDDEQRIKNLNLDELNHELAKRDIQFFNKDNKDEEVLRKRILKDNEIRKKNRIYGLLAKLFIILTLVGLFYYTKNPYVLYILVALVIYQIYTNIYFLFFDKGFEKNCIDFGSGFHLKYSQFKIGKIKNYFLQSFVYYIILTILIIFIILYYKRSRNHYVLLTIVLIFIYNVITMYKAYKIKNEVVNDIKDKIQ
tara:strand:+ start:3663 stop:4604 length:942 start_codon:yes stop_codon:yes gene_type:complete